MSWRHRLCPPMRACARIGAAVLFVLCVAPRAHADSAPDGPMWLRAPRERGPLAGTLAYDGRSSWGLDAAIPLGRIAGVHEPPRVPRLALGLSMSGLTNGATDDLRFAAVVDGRRGRAGTWLGVANDAHDAAGGRLHLGAGVWRSFAPFEAEAGMVTSTVSILGREFVSTHADSGRLGWRDSLTVHEFERTAQWTTVQGALRWHRGRVELGTIGGVTVGPGATTGRWAQATLHLRTGPRLLLLAAYGTRPPSAMAFDPTARPGTMVGMQVALAPSHEWALSGALTPRMRDWRAGRAPDGRFVAWLRCRNARAVELTGDFTDWTPVSLEAREGGWWRVALDVPPGLHQVQVRLNGGAWQPPPGLPRTQGAFAGVAGVVVME